MLCNNEINSDWNRLYETCNWNLFCYMGNKVYYVDIIVEKIEGLKKE